MSCFAVRLPCKISDSSAYYYFDLRRKKFVNIASFFHYFLVFFLNLSILHHFPIISCFWMYKYFKNFTKKTCHMQIFKWIFSSKNSKNMKWTLFENDNDNCAWLKYRDKSFGFTGHKFKMLSNNPQHLLPPTYKL